MSRQGQRAGTEDERQVTGPRVRKRPRSASTMVSSARPLWPRHPRWGPSRRPGSGLRGSNDERQILRVCRGEPLRYRGRAVKPRGR